MQILQNDRRELEEASVIADDASSDADSPLLQHPLASRFLHAVVDWIRTESIGGDAVKEFQEMRMLALRLVASESPR